MTSHSLIYQGSKSQLVNQLVYFDEEKTSFLDQHFPEFNQRRQTAERALGLYSEAVEGILADFSPEKLNGTVLIGSRLKLRYLDDDTAETFTIVFPHLSDPDRNLVSFLSPLGFQLLLAKPDDSYRLDVPSGELTVRVEEIQFVNQGEIHA